MRGTCAYRLPRNARVPQRREQPHGDCRQMTHSPVMIAPCACGSVEVTALGKPIVSAACSLRRLPEGRGAARGSAERACRPRSRRRDGLCALSQGPLRMLQGAELPKSHKLKDISPTNRVVATCCNSAMFVSFDRGPHWVSAYRARFHGELLPCRPGSAEVQTGRRRAVGRCAELSKLSARSHGQASGLAHRDGAGKMSAWNG